jgi:TRAP-type uncharacterized transport system substrate-binding protein
VARISTERTGTWVAPTTTRSLLALEVASELIGKHGVPPQARITLRTRPGEGSHSEFGIFGSDAPSVFDEVARGDVDMGIINPAEILALANNGTGPFKVPIPVRTITVIPSDDQFLFAIHERTGIERFEDIKAKRYPLRISVRAQTDHSDHVYIGEVLKAVGVSLDDIVSWGGAVHRHPGIPREPEVRQVTDGEFDAIFDEAVNRWAPAAHQAGMRFMNFDEPLLERLEGMGFRRAQVNAQLYPEVAAVLDVETLDFSGWPVFVRADVSDEMVHHICGALEERKDRIPWQGEGPLPLDQMCIDAIDAPLTVPLHPAAEEFWRGRGYLS